MIFNTKGEFIQALKDYETYDELSEKEKERQKRLGYLLYGKVKSPLDYDIVGYENGEAIRAIKSQGSITQQQITDSRNELEKKYDESCSRYGKLIGKMVEINRELESIDEPLQSILRVRYMEHKKLKDVCRKFKKLMLDEAGMYKYIMRELDKYYKNEEGE